MPPQPRVVELVGVYDAEGTVIGEVRYWVGARLGRAHCALCDITHGMFRRRPEWNQCEAALPVPFTTFHRDDRPDDVRAAGDGNTPIVLARLDDGSLLALVTPERLAELDGPDALVAEFAAAASRLELDYG
ncbi:MAG: hypothetical protein ACOYNI_00925 [Acidimicrobiia bacterium]